uniref:Uncharacterized protein n=1 Tax=Haptolina ericina TaxID=156174 RepID=A0A6T9EAG2_9EUKA|mmetsp:Transcript_30780/g.69455  ORF Transcript_30780/g.69455 Transcript_30780/m.69455 type:complete len:246 (+) Transcript_30780:1624-2361(+)
MTVFSRNAKGGKQKGGKHKSKQEVRRERTARAPAPAPTSVPPTTAEEQLKAKRAAGAAKVKAWRDRTGGKAAAAPKPGAKPASKEQRTKQEASKAIAVLPKGLCATAAGRSTAYETAGRKGDGARQALERDVRSSVAKVKKLKSQGKMAQAAAVVSGFNNDPAVRPLLPAAVGRESLDATVAETMIANAGDLIANQTRGGGRGSRTSQAALGQGLCYWTHHAMPNASAQPRGGLDECKLYVCWYI